MGKKLVGGTIVGGIILFVWMSVSWMVVPWHCKTWSGFKDEAAVAQVLTANMTNNGIYILPNACGKDQSMEDLKNSPFAFVSIRRNFEPMNAGHFIFSIITQLIAAFLTTYLLLQMAAQAYWRKVLSAVLIGLLISVASLLPAMNWWGFNFSYVLVGFCDSVIGWFLAGLAIAAFAKE